MKLTQGEKKLIESLRSGTSKLHEYIRIHTEEKNGHYVGDEGWQELGRYATRIMEICMKKGELFLKLLAASFLLEVII